MSNDHNLMGQSRDYVDADARKRRVMAELMRYPFRRAWWLRGRDCQTVYGPVLRRQAIPFRRVERIGTVDGDFLDLHIHDGAIGAPTVLILHGLEGSARSHYVIGLQRAFAERGWSSAVMEFRSCGGEMNLAKRLYHSGETTDLDAAVGWTLAGGAARLYLVGFSLGGNVVAKWLGEQGEEAPGLVAGAAVVSVPYDLAASADYFERTLRGLYGRRFLRTLIPKALEKERQYPGSLDVAAVRNSRTFREFDTHATARLHGFRDATDYWAQSSSGPYLQCIRRPTLLVSAEDDPFIPAQSLPRVLAETSPWLYPQWTSKGGHVGFVRGQWPCRSRYWAEEQIVRFFELQEKEIADSHAKSTY